MAAPGGRTKAAKTRLPESILRIAPPLSISGLSPFGICLSVKLRTFPESFENRRPKESVLKTYPVNARENPLYCLLGVLAFFA